MKYESPWLEVILIEVEDVVTLSEGATIDKPEFGRPFNLSDGENELL